VPTIRLAHGPDADDSLMFCALAAGRVYTGDRAYVHDPAGIEALDRRAAPLDIVVATPGTRSTTPLALLLYQPAALTDIFLRMCANDFTAVRGGRTAVRCLLDEGRTAGLWPARVQATSMAV
jgi:hypothetical protein